MEANRLARHSAYIGLLAAALGVAGLAFAPGLPVAGAAPPPRFPPARRGPIINLELDPQKRLDSAFRLAAREGRLDELKDFARRGAKVDSRSDRKLTPLMFASRACQARAVEFLLANGADVNLQDARGRTALMHAVGNSCVEVVKVLVAADSIDLGLRDGSGKTALARAELLAVTEVDSSAARIARHLREASKRR